MKTFKLTTLLFLLLAVKTGTCAQAPSWEWLQCTGSAQNNNIITSSSDRFGHIYVAGTFSGGTMTMGSTTLTNIDSGLNTAFIARYDNAGNVIWARSAQGYNTGHTNVNITSQVITTCTDHEGNVYAAGDFSGNMVVFGTDTLFSPGTTTGCYFIVKYDSSGNLIKAQTSSIVTGQGISDISVDAAGELYMTGSYYMSARFGSTLLQTNGSNVYTAKYDTSWQPLWAKTAIVTGPVLVQGTAITTDSTGYVYVTGFFQDDSIILSGYTLYNPSPYGSLCTFTAEYDPAGNILWANAPWANNNTSNTPADIIIDHQGNAYVAGHYDGQYIIFDGDTLRHSTATTDMYLIKYDPLGNILWSRTAQSTVSPLIYGFALAMDDKENIYLLGSARSMTNLILENDTIPLHGQNVATELFVAKYTNAGSLQWVQTAGDGMLVAPGINAHTMTVDITGATYVGGTGNVGTYNFGSLQATIPSGCHNFFLAKLDSSSRVISGVSTVLADEINIYPNPSAGHINITAQTNTHLTVTDATGQVLSYYDLYAGNNPINMVSIADGVYFLNFSTQISHSTKKIVLMK